MPDLIADGLSWLDGQRDLHLGRTVTYRRGSDEVSVTATVGRTEYEEFGTDGSVVRSESRDYIIRVSDLATLLGAGLYPLEGDEIIEAFDGYELVCEAMTITAGTETWRYHDRRQNQYRITTKIKRRAAT